MAFSAASAEALALEIPFPTTNVLATTTFAVKPPCERFRDY